MMQFSDGFLPRAFFMCRMKSFLSVALCFFVMACGGGGGGGTSGATVTTPAAVVSISASASTGIVGQAIDLTWSAANTNATSCTASGAWSGQLALAGTQSVKLLTAGTLSYTLNCNGVSNAASVVVSAVPAVSIALASSNVIASQSSVLTWSSSDASSCTASGAWSGTKALAGSLQISQAAAGSYSYAITCTGPGGSATSSATLVVSTGPGNTASIIVDSGPVAANSVINVPYVSVTVCRPGTAICQTIDHVLIDTGSYGLRLIAPLDTALALPAVQTASGAQAGECVQFVSGYTWGAIQQADVKIGSEKASAISIQVINDGSAAFAAVPGNCSNAGRSLGTVAALGANGILGIGMFRQDCGNACVTAPVPGTYYACTGANCVASSMPLAKQVINPVTAFATDNNGVLIVFPVVPAGGLVSLSGSLIFGIGTQSNNKLASETIYAANTSGNFTTVYKGSTWSSSFLDSGSNGLFFADQNIPGCAQSISFYCPANTLNLTAVNSAYDASKSGTVSFSIENLENLDFDISAASIGGTNGTRLSGSRSFDWGLPFFFGRRVFVGFEATAGLSGSGRYWAY